MDVKPWGALVSNNSSHHTNNALDDETDMKELEAAVRSIQKDGLVWGLSQLVPVGFGIKKLQINLIIEDDKISLSDLEEEIAGFEDYVQSTDIVGAHHILTGPLTNIVPGCHAKAIEHVRFSNSLY